jgi:hypothetical protein
MNIRAGRGDVGERSTLWINWELVSLLTSATATLVITLLIIALSGIPFQASS